MIMFRYFLWLLIELALILDYSVRSRQKKSKTVTIVRLDALGDFLIFIKCMKAIVDYYRSAGYSICFVVPQEIQSLLALYFPNEDYQIFAVDTKKMRRSTLYRLDLTRKLRRISTEISIAPVFSRIPLHGTDLVLLALGANKSCVQTGYVPKSWAANVFKNLITKMFECVSSFPNTRSKIGRWEHETVANQAFVSNLLGTSNSDSYPLIPEYEKVNLLELELPSRYIALMPGGSWTGKCWPRERYSNIVSYLTSKNYTVVLLGDGNDKTVCDYICDANDTPSVVNLCGKTNFAQLFNVISNAELFLGNDSFGIHIAHLLNIRSICITWGGSFGRFVPYPTQNHTQETDHKTVFKHMECFGCTGSCPHEKIEGKVKCISSVESDEVLSALRSFGLT